MGKSIKAAKPLLEEMASNNYHWSSDQVTPQRGGGKYSVDAVTLLASRVDALAQRNVNNNICLYMYIVEFICKYI